MLHPVQLKDCNWKTLGSDLVFFEYGMSDELIEVAGKVALCFVGNVSICFNLIMSTLSFQQRLMIMCYASDLWVETFAIPILS
jgi:hypothetical protein